MANSNTTNKGVKRDTYLPRGVVERVAIKFNVTKAYVSQVKSGHRNNIQILKAIITEVKLREKEVNALVRKLNKKAK